MKYDVPIMGEHCPWHSLAKMAPPNVKWCEAFTCGWISEPANTWSNLFYLGLTWWAWKVSKDKEEPILKAFVPAFFFMGLFSFIYHASYNFFTQWFDFIGMFLMTGLFIALNLSRMGKLSREKIFPFYLSFLGFFGALVIIFYLTMFPIQSIIAVQALFLMGSEAYLRKMNPDANYKPFVISVVLILVAATFSILDVTRVFCDPHNHFIQGHAIWHLFSALSLSFAFKFYSQFSYSDRK